MTSVIFRTHSPYHPRLSQARRKASRLLGVTNPEPGYPRESRGVFINCGTYFFMTKDRAILLFGLVTYGMGQSLLYVIFGPLARDLGLSEWQFGVLISASNIAVVAMSPMWGRVSQARGRKNVFIFGLLGYAVGYSGLAFGIQIGLWGWLAPIPLFMLLFGARIVYGAMASAISPSATAYIADTTDAI